METEQGELPAGMLDGVDGHEVVGWAWRSDNVDARVIVGIYEGDNLVCQGAADLFRSDLRKAGIGDGRHGFRITLPASVLDGGAHTLTARILPDGIQLPGESALINADHLAGHLRYDGYLDFQRGLTVGGWAWDRTCPNDPVYVDILLDDRVVLTVRADRMRSDLQAAGLGDGRHGFIAHITTPTDTVGAVRIAARISGVDSRGFELRGSPRETFIVDAPHERWHSPGQITGIVGGSIVGTVHVNAPSMDVDLFDEEQFLQRLTVPLKSGQGAARWAVGSLSHFVIPVPSQLCDGALHAIRVRVVQLAKELEGGPLVFQCPDPGLLGAQAFISQFDSVYAMVPVSGGMAGIAELGQFLASALPLTTVVQVAGTVPEGAEGEVMVPAGGNLHALAQAHQISRHKAETGHCRSLLLVEDEGLLAASMLTRAVARIAIIRSDNELAGVISEAADILIDLRRNAPAEVSGPATTTKLKVAGPRPVPSGQDINLLAALRPEEESQVLRRNCRCVVVIEMPMDSGVDYELLDNVITMAPNDVRFLLAGSVANNLDGQIVRRLTTLTERRNVHLVPTPGEQEKHRLSLAADVAFFPLLDLPKENNTSLMIGQETALRYALGGACPVMNRAPISQWIREFTLVETSAEAIVATFERPDQRSIPAAARRCAYTRWLAGQSIVTDNQASEHLLDITRFASNSEETLPWRVLAHA